MKNLPGQFISNILRNTLHNIESFVFPSYCHNCHKPVSNKEILICTNCLNLLVQTELDNWKLQVTTGDYLDAVLSAFWFDNILQECIHNVKYNNYKLLLNNLSTHAAVACNSTLIRTGYDCIVPIPLHKVKYRDRGFNQSDIIAHSVSRIIGVPVKTDLVKRSGWTQTQTKLSTQKRRQNMKRAFTVAGNSELNSVLLVDDVITTGATGNACAQVLKESGCRKVDIFSLGTPRLRRALN